MNEYNSELCEERHKDIRGDTMEVFARLKKVENRHLATMTVLVVNLLGVIAILVTK